jgi:4-amino-4-deoxy-L-arabinose transferase-like glycosyltransferase
LNAIFLGSLQRFWKGHRLLCLVSAALALRLLVVLFVFRCQTNPADHHAQFGWEMGWVARSIALGNGFSSPFFLSTGPTALVPPLFPSLLAVVFRLFGIYTAGSALVILSVNSTLSALTCIPLYFSARSTFGERVAVLASLGWVIYPFAIYFSAARIWDYALTCFLLTNCFWLALSLHRYRSFIPWMSFGVLYGLTALSNPSVLSVFPVFLILALMGGRGRRRLLHGVAAALSLLAVLAPWTIRNYTVFHSFTPIRDNFWLEFWPGNDGNTFESNDHLARPPSGSAELQRFVSLGEREYLAQDRIKSLNFLHRHPFLFLKFSIHRVLSYWTGYWSLDAAYLRDQPTELPDMCLSTALSVFLLIGAFRVWKIDRDAAIRYLAIIAIFPVTYYVTHVIPDYRQPIEPEVVVLVALGILSIRKKQGRVDLLKETEEKDEFLSMFATN